MMLFLQQMLYLAEICSSKLGFPKALRLNEYPSPCLASSTDAPHQLIYLQSLTMPVVKEDINQVTEITEVALY